MLKGKKIIAVLPAYNAAKTLARTVADIPSFVDEIILVDDASQDQTVAIARGLGLKVFIHPQNRGYGGNQKTCYRQALLAGADIVVMVHPDHQYDPKSIPELVEALVVGRADATLGSRMMTKKNALSGGMPWWKFAANIFLTQVENLALGLRLTEYHSGFRAYNKKVLATLPLEENSDDFVFDTQIIIQMKINGFTIKEVPIATRYFKEASMIGFIKSLAYGLAILKTLLLYGLFRFFQLNREKFLKNVQA